MVREDAGAYNSIEGQFVSAFVAAQTAAGAGLGGTFYGLPDPWGGSPTNPIAPFSTGEGGNWGNAVGGFVMSGNLEIVQNTLTITIHMWDWYNFHDTNLKGAMGTLCDNDLADLHETGLARSFPVDLGSITITINNFETRTRDDVRNILRRHLTDEHARDMAPIFGGRPQTFNTQDWSLYD